MDKKEIKKLVINDKIVTINPNLKPNELDNNPKEKNIFINNLTKQPNNTENNYES